MQPGQLAVFQLHIISCEQQLHGIYILVFTTSIRENRICKFLSPPQSTSMPPQSKNGAWSEFSCSFDLQLRVKQMYEDTHAAMLDLDARVLDVPFMLSRHYYFR